MLTHLRQSDQCWQLLLLSSLSWCGNPPSGRQPGYMNCAIKPSNEAVQPDVNFPKKPWNGSVQKFFLLAETQQAHRSGLGTSWQRCIPKHSWNYQSGVLNWNVQKLVELWIACDRKPIYGHHYQFEFEFDLIAFPVSITRSTVLLKGRTPNTSSPVIWENNYDEIKHVGQWVSWSVSQWQCSEWVSPG